jgi:(1->4)-alpha-D-glucan 1-alpha-D-glucosylmutase
MPSNRLISLNEVGGSPDRFRISAEAFHGQEYQRIRILASCIDYYQHDTKRSEDVRQG